MPRRPRGFTLIELLVVIAIIALLVSILLPSLQRAKELANTTVCETRQKALATSIHMYATENDNTVPFCNSNGMETGHPRAEHQPGWLYHHKEEMSKDDVELEDGLLWDYIGDAKGYRCPADQPPWDQGPTHRLTSYLMNRATVGGSDSNFPPYGLEDFHTDDIVLWEVDETRGGGVWNDGCNNPGEGITERHKTGATVACFGGHVEWIGYDEFYALADDDQPNRLRCAPKQDDGW